MNRGGRLDAADGFTIVEVMIVLAVSGVMLISAIALINGRQARTEFTTGINDELSQFQEIITDTSDGYYPNNNDVTCTGNPGSEVTLKAVAHGSAQQGTYAGCIYLGSAVQFGLSSTSPGYSTLGVLPIVGNAYQSVAASPNTPVMTLSEAFPRALYPVGAPPIGTEVNVPTDAVSSDFLENGLQIANGNNACTGITNVAACYIPANAAAGASPTPTGMVAFVSGDSLGNIAAPTSSTNSNLKSSSQQLSLYAVEGSQKNDALGAASGFIHNYSATSKQGLVAAQEVLVCISDYGGAGQSGLFTFGGSSNVTTHNGGLGVTLQIKEDATC